MREPLGNHRVALLLVCVGVAGWVLVGCFPPQTPGQPSPSTKLTLTYEKATRTAEVGLPEGSGVDPTKLTVMSSVGTATPGSDGSASVEVIEPGPQLAVVLSPGGKPMLLGWLDDYHPSLDCRTTAEVLLYHRLCLWLIPPEVVHRAVGGLHQTNVLGPIVTALEQAIVADPEGLLSGDAAVTAAVEAAAQQVLASAPNAKGKASAAMINPEEARSGLTVTQTGGMNAVTIANALR
ncbi:MAG: hypothetical protein JXQ73_23350, partial [Phycisphaerae bacterium]|nr:hypothetical protein [Phycisphaerae bacterium]